LDHDLVLVPAALSDYAPTRKKGKIASDRGVLTLELKAVPKVLPKLVGKTKVVGFKAESGVREEELITRALERLERHGLDAMVANDLRNVRMGTTEVYLVERGSNPIMLKGNKSEVAWGIMAELRGLL
jgi:phosphopantothenoylcysteine decarboxylase/phosphopantothenate--cysteine ligase